MVKDVRSRNFCFTLNNFTEEHVQSLLDLPNRVPGSKANPCRYVLVGKEIAPSTGTPHLQGLVVYTQPACMKTVLEWFKLTGVEGCHMEKCRGTVEQNISYCKKEHDWYEAGDKPMTQEEKGEKGKEYYEEILKLAKADQMDDIPAQALIQHGPALRYYRDEESKKRKFEDTEDQMLWYYGGTGTGKSYKARKEHPEAYLKMCNKWWDGYENHDVVLVEDFDKKHDVLCHHVKLWADRYPFLAEYKGGAKKIRPKLIIITSNWHPSDIWTDERDLEPILRRFKITRFDTFPKP